MLQNKLKQIFIYCLIPIVILVIFDLVTKRFATNLLEEKYWGFLKFKLVYNYGFIGGSFSNLSLKIRELIFFTFAFYILVLFSIVMILAPIRSRKTFLGCAFIQAGIIGNSIDRIYNFGVVDFISINLNYISAPYLNFADITQWIGYIVLIMGLINDYRFYWPTSEWRHNFIINKSFQFKISIGLGAVAFLLTMFAFIFSFLFFKTEIASQDREIFILCASLISCVNMFVTFVGALIVTHRIAGPVYAIQRHINLIFKQEYVKFQLRSSDEFKEIEDDVNTLTFLVKRSVEKSKENN